MVSHCFPFICIYHISQSPATRSRFLQASLAEQAEDTDKTPVQRKSKAVKKTREVAALSRSEYTPISAPSQSTPPALHPRAIDMSELAAAIVDLSDQLGHLTTISESIQRDMHALVEVQRGFWNSIFNPKIYDPAVQQDKNAEPDQAENAEGPVMKKRKISKS